jgi:hypothetical protein
LQVAPPRLGGKRVGLFSTRSPHRPNPLGITLAKIVKIDGGKIHLQGLDLLDQTPIIDIKPYIPQYDIPKTISDTVQDNPEELETEQDQVKVPSWISDKDKCLEVSFTPRALQSFDGLQLESLNSVKDLKEAIRDVLSEDPRSNYRRDKCSDRLYYFNVDNVKVTCWFDNEVAEVLKLSQCNMTVPCSMVEVTS